MTYYSMYITGFLRITFNQNVISMSFVCRLYVVYMSL